MSAPRQPETGRRSERERLTATVQCRRGTMRQTIEIADLSISGVKLATRDPLRVGQTIWIRLPTLEAQEAQIVWSEGRSAGCRFSRPLHPAVFQLVMRAGGRRDG